MLQQAVAFLFLLFLVTFLFKLWFDLVEFVRRKVVSFFKD